MTSITIEGNEVLALHRMLYKRKFLDGPTDEFFGSPLIAAVQRRLLAALAQDDPEGWAVWGSTVPSHVTDRIADHTGSGSSKWWDGASETDRAAFVADCAAPHTLTTDTIESLVRR